MSFYFLPLQMFVALAFGAAVGVFILAWKYWNIKPRLLSICLVLYGFGAIGAGLLRINEETQFWENNLLLGLFIAFSTGTAFVLSIIAGFIKVKDDQKKRELFLKILFWGFGTMFTLILLAVYFYSKIE